MLCKQCGEQVGEAQRFCSKCGARLYPDNPQGQPSEYYAPISGMPPEDGQTNYTELDYNKLGGWLLVFVIVSIVMIFPHIRTLFFAGVLSAISLLFNEVLPSFEPLTALFIIAYTVSAVTSIVSAVFPIIWVVMIFRRSPKFLLVIQIAGLIRIALMISYAVIEFLSSARSILFTVGSLLFYAAGFFLLIYYFCRSVRVRAYMGSEEYKKYLIFRFKPYL